MMNDNQQIPRDVDVGIVLQRFYKLSSSNQRHETSKKKKKKRIERLSKEIDDRRKTEWKFNSENTVTSSGFRTVAVCGREKNWFTGG